MCLGIDLNFGFGSDFDSESQTMVDFFGHLAKRELKPLKQSNPGAISGSEDWLFWL